MSSSPHPLDLLVRDLEQRSQLSEEYRRQIRALPFTMRTLEAGSYTVREAEAPLHCAMIVSGFAYRHKLTGEGMRQIVAVLLPGSAVDLQSLFLDVADHNVQMLTRGDVAFVPQAELHALARANAAVAHAILVKILVEASVYREWNLNVGRRNARTRLAHLFCELGTRLDALGLVEDYGYHLPMTQEELADAVGLTPVHVNRTLKGLEADGLIARNRRRVSFPDWERLREAGDFNARYLHLERQHSSALHEA